MKRDQLLEFQDLLKEKDRRRQEDPLRYAKEHPKQDEASKSLQAIRALFWGNRVGKTEWGAMEVARYVLGKHPYKDLVPPVEVWCACPSYDAQEETTQKKLLLYIPPNEIERMDYLRGTILRKIVLKNGSNIVFKSYEQGREKFQGAGKRLIWFDEEPPRDIYEECFVRVEAGQQLDVVLTMTPVKGMTWVYDVIYMDTSNPDVFISTAGWDDNPFLTESQKAQMSRGLSPEALKVRKDGLFVKRVGLVCNWWERKVHLKHYDFLNPEWTWFEVLDGGYSDPAAWLFIGVDNDDSVHIVDGFLEKELSAAQIKERRDQKVGGMTVTQGFIDNDDPRLREHLSEKGMSLDPVEKLPGEAKSWDEVLAEKLYDYGHVQPGTGLPRLYVSDNLIRHNPDTGERENWLVQQIENLVWLERSRKEGDEIIPKWDAHRRFGHHFDGVYALSYFLVMYKKGSIPDVMGGFPDKKAWAIGA